ncbi:uncharacterized protein LOC114829545 [Esox lucius]|uniref:uncharacterized protein LOC114829545 n=1 Tax=Esox lucius TaxID=8010 RepID=UPI001476B460|nr:uncharacterized protein LOC114829545 [Esox lucius]
MKKQDNDALWGEPRKIQREKLVKKTQIEQTNKQTFSEHRSLKVLTASNQSGVQLNRPKSSSTSQPQNSFPGSVLPPLTIGGSSRDTGVREPPIKGLNAIGLGEDVVRIKEKQVSRDAKREQSATTLVKTTTKFPDIYPHKNQSGVQLNRPKSSSTSQPQNSFPGSVLPQLTIGGSSRDTGVREPPIKGLNAIGLGEDVVRIKEKQVSRDAKRDQSATTLLKTTTKLPDIYPHKNQSKVQLREQSATTLVKTTTKLPDIYPHKTGLPTVGTDPSENEKTQGRIEKLSKRETEALRRETKRREREEEERRKKMTTRSKIAEIESKIEEANRISMEIAKNLNFECDALKMLEKECKTSEKQEMEQNKREQKGREEEEKSSSNSSLASSISSTPVSTYNLLCKLHFSLNRKFRSYLVRHQSGSNPVVYKSAPIQLASTPLLSSGPRVWFLSSGLPVCSYLVCHQSSSYPVGHQSGSYPVGHQSSSYPVGHQSSSYPVGHQSSSYPVGHQSSSYPVGHQSSSYPVGHQSSSYPVGHQSSSYPVGHQSSSYPVGHQSSSYPVGHQSSSYLVRHLSSSNPVAYKSAPTHSGFYPVGRQSGFYPVGRQSGFYPVGRLSDFYPSSSFPVGHQSSSFPVGHQSSSFPVGLQSCSFPVGLQSCSFPVGLQSCSYPVGHQSSSYPVGHQSNSYPVGHQSSSYPVGHQSSSYPVGHQSGTAPKRPFQLKCKS